MTKIIRKNLTNYYNPVGNYTHITKIPAQLDTYVFSGQIGMDNKGIIPSEFHAEIEQLFANIKQLLDSEEISADDITKVNIWSVKEIDWDHFDLQWNKYFKGNDPSMTIAYVKALGLPEITIEIDIWAAK